ncbi:hypothetical protein MRX96_042316 [Rhipicephalus microplus]
MTVLSAYQECEEDRTNYSVFYAIDLAEEATLFPCLQCFAPPCEANGEQLVTPIFETENVCCRMCSHMAVAGNACNLQRDEPAVVCQDGNICSATKKVCVKECHRPP